MPSPRSAPPALNDGPEADGPCIAGWATTELSAGKDSGFPARTQVRVARSRTRPLRGEGRGGQGGGRAQQHAPAHNKHACLAYPFGWQQRVAGGAGQTHQFCWACAPAKIEHTHQARAQQAARTREEPAAKRTRTWCNTCAPARTCAQLVLRGLVVRVALHHLLPRLLPLLPTRFRALRRGQWAAVGSRGGEGLQGEVSPQRPVYTIPWTGV